MPTPAVRLELVDAAELAEMLALISQWLAGPDHAQLAASIGRPVGTDGYDLTALRADLALFTFLLRDHREQLVDHGGGEPLPAPATGEWPGKSHGVQSRACADILGPMIEGVFFDGDQTLWDFEVLMRRALASTLEHLRELRPGADTDGLDVESMVADGSATSFPCCPS